MISISSKRRVPAGGTAIQATPSMNPGGQRPPGRRERSDGVIPLASNLTVERYLHTSTPMSNARPESVRRSRSRTSGRFPPPAGTTVGPVTARPPAGANAALLVMSGNNRTGVTTKPQVEVEHPTTMQPRLLGPGSPAGDLGTSARRLIAQPARPIRSQDDLAGQSAASCSGAGYVARAWMAVSAIV